MRTEIRFKMCEDGIIAKYFIDGDNSGYDIFVEPGETDEQEFHVGEYFGTLDEVDDPKSNDYKNFLEYYMNQDLTSL